MIAIFYEEIELGKARAITVHYMPEELSQETLEGALLIPKEQMPIQEERENFVGTLYCNPETNELWYEYEELPPTIEARVEALESALLAMMFAGGVE